MGYVAMKYQNTKSLRTLACCASLFLFAAILHGLEAAPVEGIEASQLRDLFPPSTAQVDLSQTTHDGWRIPLVNTDSRADYVFPDDYEAKRVALWPSLVDPSHSLPESEHHTLKEVLFEEWKAGVRNALQYTPDSLRPVKYTFDVWQWSINDTLDLFEYDSRKVYVDWAIAYCEMLVANQAEESDGIIDEATGKVITAWPKAHVLLGRDKKNKPQSPEYYSYLAQIEPLKESDPEAYKKKFQEAQDKKFQTVTPMMSGHMAKSLLRTAEVIFRHPELFDAVPADYEMIGIKDCGETYLEKAVYFFNKGWQAVEFFSDNPGFWDAEQGAYVNPRNPYLKQILKTDKTQWDAAAKSIKPWNRAFAILAAQSRVMNVLKVIDAEKYAPIIARYQKQIDGHAAWWVKDSRTVASLRGLSRHWGYTYKFKWAEDTPHAMATMNLMLELYEGGCNTLSEEIMRSVAVNMLDVAYIPTQKGYGHYVDARGSTQSCGLPYLFITLTYARYHPEFWPVMADAIASHGLPQTTECGQWLSLLDGRTRYQELIRSESFTKTEDQNVPPKFVNFPKKPLTLKEGLSGGSLVTTIKAKDTSGQQISYWIMDGNYGNQFTLDSNTGALRVTEKSEIDSNIRGAYVLRIAATDDAPNRKRTERVLHIQIQSPKPDLASGLVCYYDFNDPNEGHVLDRTKKAFHGTMVAQQDQTLSWVKDRHDGQALSIAQYGYITVPHPAVKLLSRGKGVSISLWMDGYQPTFFPIIDGVDAEKNRCLRVTTWRQSMIWDAGNSGTKYDQTKQDVASKYTTGWAHWCFVKNLETQKMYVYRNGVLFSMADKTSHGFDALDALSIGSHTSTSALAEKLQQESPSDGSLVIDDVMFFNRALNRVDAEALFQAQQ